jgi:16S rRNA A1518/A1519 N6-dimethyltransferase RsmA/KsgA/DIM1 with predicted DNA glycosylase/AP lyase activity
VQGFPLASLFVKETVEEETVIKLKQGSVCAIELSDQHPRELDNCPYSIGDHVLVTYNKNNFQIEKHHLVVAAAGGAGSVNATAH